MGGVEWAGAPAFRELRELREGGLWSGNIRRGLKTVRGEPWREPGQECPGKCSGAAGTG